ncbi:MAG: hypothetical protein CVU71_17240 [Deltaproteobacteria bacterium HGW-Deltaproteobacteria-6]|jgi:protein-S-isoprenylcysteine O-methyltransferase Ste14|nr:MAG: hypothetical protein CVU71_17240 [Deltaproteobacteria bacterium HGW-Deltaproteobacteria-6]
MNYVDYFQMGSLMVFLSIFFGRTFWLKRKGTEVIRLGSGKKGFPALLEKSFLIFFPLWLLQIFIHSLNLKVQFLPDLVTKPFFTGALVQSAGVFMISAGILLFIGSLVSFKTSWRIGIDTVAPGGLITTGVFSVSRNPIFLSMDMYFLGTFLICSNLFFLLCFIGMACGFHFQIRQEEAFLNARYGNHYREYMTQVHRYF